MFDVRIARLDFPVPALIEAKAIVFILPLCIERFALCHNVSLAGESPP
jgi:hypothetical protein